MSYSDMTIEELIVLSIEFIGRGQVIPKEIQDQLDPVLLRDIQNPENTHDTQEYRSTGPIGTGT